MPRRYLRPRSVCLAGALAAWLCAPGTAASLPAPGPSEPADVQLKPVSSDRAVLEQRSLAPIPRQYTAAIASQTQGSLTATASTLEAGNYAAANAIDGNPETRWSNAFADPQWIVSVWGR